MVYLGLVVTTGGTGFGPRDLTPEGTAVHQRRRPASPKRSGVSDSDDRSFGMLCGASQACGQTLICNLARARPAAVEGFDVLAPIAAPRSDLPSPAHSDRAL